WTAVFPGGQVVPAEAVAELKEEALAMKSSSGTYRSLKPLTPSYRYGAVLKAVAISSTHKRALRRDAYQARALGMALVDRKAEIEDAVTSAILSAAAEVGRDVTAIQHLDTEVMSRFAPGLILDFPAHHFTLGSLRIRERSCV